MFVGRGSRHRRRIWYRWDKSIGLACGKEFWGRRRELDFKIKGRTNFRVRRERV